MAKLQAWLADSLQRIYPASPSKRSMSMALHAAAGERISFQICLRLRGEKAQKISVSAMAPPDIGVRVRRVGYVPLWHINTETPVCEREGAAYLPGLCPDILWEESEALLPPEETTAFWVTLFVPADSKAGKHRVLAVVKPEGGEEVRLRLTLHVAPTVLSKRRDFPVTHWFYADSLLDWYKLQPWEEKFWEILPAYFRNLVSHGQDTIYVPIFTPPLDGVKRPSQLLAVHKQRGSRYAFDWRNVRRWVRTAQKAGLEHFEWCHLFTQWGAKHALRIYGGPNGDGSLLWPDATSAVGEVYRGFLAQFLPAFKRFLDAEGLLAKSFFHLADEPHGDEHLENYRRARSLLRELAPWMRVMDALSDIRFAQEWLTDMPVPSIRVALDFQRAGIPSWCYFCCGPRGAFLNRLLDTSLAKIRMAGWLFHRFDMKGFLHWGYNYWQKSQTSLLIDPFTEHSGRAWPHWAYGDTFVVYPGDHGPLDSLRWEVWAESLQDMALLQTLGIEPSSPLLRPLRSFANFPKDAGWLRRMRSRLLLRSLAWRRSR